MKKEDCIWYDRKRHLGLPLSFTKYYIYDDRLFVESGFFTTKIDEILLYRIRDISLKITLGQKMVGVGCVTVVSSDKTLPVLDLKNIKKPREVKEILHKVVEEMKEKKNIRVGEMMDGGPMGGPMDDGMMHNSDFDC